MNEKKVQRQNGGLRIPLPTKTGKVCRDKTVYSRKQKHQNEEKGQTLGPFSFEQYPV